MASPDSLVPDLNTKQLLHLINSELHALHEQVSREYPDPQLLCFFPAIFFSSASEWGQKSVQQPPAAEMTSLEGDVTTCAEHAQPLDLGDIRKTQRRVTALLNSSVTGLAGVHPRRRRQVGMCYVCSHLDPNGRFKGRNPQWRLYRKGFFQGCGHSPVSPTNTLNDVAEEGEEKEEADVINDSGMFDTKILSRDDHVEDPRFFSLPPIFDTPRSKHDLVRDKGKFVPVTSEKTFLSTHVRRPPQEEEDEEVKGSRTSSRQKKAKPEEIHLPDVNPRKVNLVMTHGGNPYTAYDDEGESNIAAGREAEGKISERRSRQRKDEEEEKEEERTRRRRRTKGGVPKLPSFGPWGEDSTMDKSILRHHERQQQQQRSSLDGTGSEPRRRRRRRRPRGEGVDESIEEGDVGSDFYSDFSDDRSWSSQSLTLSREATLDEDSSPSMLVSKLRTLSWCECSEVDLSKARCEECFQVGGHKQWCMSRSLTCGTCGKAIRKVKDRRRRSSNSLVTNAFEASTSDPASAHARDKCSANGQRRSRSKVTTGKVKVTFRDEVDQREILPSEQQEHDATLDEKPRSPPMKFKPGSQLPTHDLDLHRHAYSMALADVKAKRFKVQPDDVLNGVRGPLFSYFPLWQYRGKNSLNPSDLGLRPPGKGVKVKKGLKHILGSVDIGDYYPGGRKNPRVTASHDGAGLTKKTRPLTD